MDTPTSTPEQPRKKEKPIVFVGKKRAHLGTGRRKTSVARIFLTDGTGKITVNDRPLNDYFTEVKDRNAVLGPLLVTEMANRVDIKATVVGGGFSGQAGACSQGVARALKNYFGISTGAPTEGTDEAIVNLGKKLRESGFLTRDGRMKERKKYGRKGARKAFQFSKR
ncbi:MAG: 30S ribosomal protein S9 [Gemmataceae bacterium]